MWLVVRANLSVFTDFHIPRCPRPATALDVSAINDLESVAQQTHITKRRWLGGVGADVVFVVDHCLFLLRFTNGKACLPAVAASYDVRSGSVQF